MNNQEQIGTQRAKSSFTDGKARIATEADVHADWGGYKDGRNFRCAFCGFRFKVGDQWRWFYTNDTTDVGGNPFVCANCDGSRELLLTQLRTMKAGYEAMRNRYWWFCRA